MATPQTTATAITTKSPEQKSLRDLVASAAKELGRALPAHMNPERVVRIAQTCITLTPELANCTPASFMGSLFVLAQLGLEPIAGRAYLLPFNNRRNVNGQWVSIKEVQAVIGYKGYIDLFYRHESSLMIDMQTVHEKDEFDYQYGTSAFLRHTPAKGDRGAAVGFYALAHLKGGAYAFRVMTKAEAMEHGKKHSKTFDKEKSAFNAKSPWTTEPDAMCMKTVLLQLSKILPLSVELQRALAVDETSRDFREGVGDAMDLPSTTNWSEAETSAPVPTGKEVFLAAFQKHKKTLGNKKYYEILGANGWEHSTQVPSEEAMAKILDEMAIVAEKG